MGDNRPKLKKAIADLSGLTQELGANTASTRDSVLEEMSAEQERIKDMVRRLQEGEDSPELSEQYVDSVGRLGQLYDLLANIQDDMEEARQYRGDTSEDHR